MATLSNDPQIPKLIPSSCEATTCPLHPRNCNPYPYQQMNPKIKQVLEMLCEGWGIAKVMEYFTILDDWSGINATITVAKGGKITP